MFWTDSLGRIELKISKRQAASCSHQGQCDDDVKSLSEVPAIRRQLSKITPATLSACLREYGAWDDSELADHEQNLQRILWIACCDITEGE